MLFLIQASFDTPTTNDLVRRGDLEKTVQSILDDLKPEAIYFTEDEGRRLAVLVVNIKDASEIPKVAEPWFLAFNAEVKFMPAMRPEDLMKAGPAIKAAAEKY